MGTILVLAALAVIVGLIIRGMVRDRKNGKSPNAAGTVAAAAAVIS